MRNATLVVLGALLAVPAAAGDAETYGKPLSGMDARPLADVLDHAEDGTDVCVEGRVAAVCTNKGCWLELAQGERSVHVTFADYSFFVPKDSKGRAVRLEGKLKVAEADADATEHLKSEGASDAAASRVSIVASGVELREAD